MSTDRRTLELCGAQVDLGQGVLVRGEERARLSTKEVEVLAYLAERPGRAISHEELLEAVWEHSRLASTQPVYSVMKRLRRKIDGHGGHRHLVSVHGVGYRFEPPPGASVPLAARGSVSWSQLSSFVGREAELARAQAALAAGARLISLTGPGGAGKTRAASELVARARRRGEDVVFCDLSDARTSADLIRMVAAQIGARAEESDDRPIETALAARATALLVLDNVEQLVESVAAECACWASVTPLLVTSRERLGVPGEHVISIGPLDPAPSAQLFRERAEMAGLRVSPDDARVGRIVERLEGLPLAIELAASRAGAVALESLIESLERPMLELTPTLRGLPARHATLRASVEWSWALLTDEERTVLARTSVFAGGFTEAAAEAVVGLERTRPALHRLLERSLLRRGPGASRLRLYEAVRELAAERLDDAAAIHARHAAWAASLARDAGALEAVPPEGAYGRLAPEAENLLAAFRRTLASAPHLAGELALALDLVWRRSAAPEREEVLRAAAAATRGALEVRLRLALGRTQQQRGERGLAFLEETVALAEAEGDLELIAEAERLVASCAAAMGEPGRVLARLEEVYARAGSAPAVSRGRVALELGIIHRAAAGLTRARQLVSEAERILAAERDFAEAARAASVLSNVSREQGRLDLALADLDRARSYLEEHGDEAALAGLEVERGILLASMGEIDDARCALSAGIAAHGRLGLAASELRARDWLVLALLGAGRTAEARVEIVQMRRIARALGRDAYEPERAEGAVLITEERYAEADDALTRALAILQAGGEVTVRGHVLSLRGLARVMMDRLDDAIADLAECARIHIELGGPSATASARSAADLAVVRELAAPREDTDEVLDRAALVSSRSAADAREVRLHRATVAVARARRAGAGLDEARSIAAEARRETLGPSGEPPDWLTRCTLLLLQQAVESERVAQETVTAQRSR